MSESNGAGDGVLNINVDDLTVAELEEIEERTGMPFDAFARPDTKKGALLRAMVFVIKRRDDPAYSWEQAGDERIQMASSEESPTVAAG